MVLIIFLLDGIFIYSHQVFVTVPGNAVHDLKKCWHSYVHDFPLCCAPSLRSAMCSSKETLNYEDIIWRYLKDISEIVFIVFMPNIVELQTGISPHNRWKKFIYWNLKPVKGNFVFKLFVLGRACSDFANVLRMNFQIFGWLQEELYTLFFVSERGNACSAGYKFSR